MKRLLLLAFVLANVKAGATGVCLTCPTGFNCTDGIPVADSNARQVLVREGGKAVWKDVSTVTTLRGPQGAPGPTGPAGPQGKQGLPACLSSGATPEWSCALCSSSGDSLTSPGKCCWCRLKGQGTCASSWVFANIWYDAISECSNNCHRYCESSSWMNNLW